MKSKRLKDHPLNEDLINRDLHPLHKIIIWIHSLPWRKWMIQVSTICATLIALGYAVREWG